MVGLPGREKPALDKKVEEIIKTPQIFLRAIEKEAPTQRIDEIQCWMASHKNKVELRFGCCQWLVLGSTDVLSALLFYVLHRANNEIVDIDKTATFKTFLLDEAWLFLGNETIRNYVTKAQKTWRKHNAAMIMATQNIEDLQKSGMLGLVATACPTKIFLANPDMDRELYAEAFHLNDTEIELIAGLIPPGEMVIRRARSSKKVRLEVDSVSYWMATNNSKDNVKKHDYFARFGVAEGIKRLAADFPFRAR